LALFFQRFQGIGAPAVTYGVGALNVARLNAIAGSHEESSPIEVVSGALGVSE